MLAAHAPLTAWLADQAAAHAPKSALARITPPEPPQAPPSTHAEAWLRNPRHRHVYNKMLLCELQGFDHAPLPVMAEDFPVVLRSAVDLHGTTGLNGTATQVDIIAGPAELAARAHENKFWTSLITGGDHYYYDLVVAGGRPKFALGWRVRAKNTEDECWETLPAAAKLPASCAAALRSALSTYTGPVNFQCIREHAIDCGLRLGTLEFLAWFAPAALRYCLRICGSLPRGGAESRAPPPRALHAVWCWINPASLATLDDVVAAIRGAFADALAAGRVAAADAVVYRVAAGDVVVRARKRVAMLVANNRLLADELVARAIRRLRRVHKRAARRRDRARARAGDDAATASPAGDGALSDGALSDGALSDGALSDDAATFSDDGATFSDDGAMSDPEDPPYQIRQGRIYERGPAVMQIAHARAFIEPQIIHGYSYYKRASMISAGLPAVPGAPVADAQSAAHGIVFPDPPADLPGQHGSDDTSTVYGDSARSLDPRAHSAAQ